MPCVFFFHLLKVIAKMNSGFRLWNPLPYNIDFQQQYEMKNISSLNIFFMWIGWSLLAAMSANNFQNFTLIMKETHQIRIVMTQACFQCRRKYMVKHFSFHKVILNVVYVHLVSFSGKWKEIITLIRWLMSLCFAHFCFFINPQTTTTVYRFLDITLRKIQMKLQE